MISDVPPDWLILETVIRLQKLKRYEYNPTAPIIHNELCKASGTPYQWEFTHERLEALAEQRVLLRSPGGYDTSVRFRIHPDYYSEGLDDPYTEKEREALRKMINPRGLAPEELDRIKRERQREQREEQNRKSNLRAKRNRLKKRTTDQSIQELQNTYELHRLSIDTAQVLEIMEQDPGDVLIIDTETTGLSCYKDDVLELSIINGYGVTIYSHRFDALIDSWDEAEMIHGIKPQDVRGLPLLEDEAPTITGHLRRARVIVGYNVFFDIGFLTHGGVTIPRVPICDVMEEFSSVYGEWADWIDEGEGGYKWQTLTKAGAHYGIDTKGAHGSLKDTQITLEVLKRLGKEPEHLRKRERPED